MASILQLNEFFIEGEKQDLSHVLLHIIEPSNPAEEKKKGYFFAICEINKGDKNDILNLQALMDEIENDYYDTPDTPETNSLEMILEKINDENFILSGEDSELNCLVGTLKGSELTFSFCGLPEAVLFFKNKMGQYKKMDLVAANEEENEDDKLFSQIIQGKISEGDYFFAGTAHIANSFSHDRLQKIITSRTTEQSAEHLEKVLRSIKNGYSYGGLVVHFTPEFAGSHPPSKPTDDIKKADLSDTEAQTARTLSPSLINNLNTKVKSMMRAKDIEDEDNDDKAEEKKEKTIPTNKNIIFASATQPEREESSMAKITARTKSSNVDGQAVIYLKNIFQIIWKGLKYAGMGIYWFFFALAKITVNIGRFFVMLFIIIINYKNRRRSILESWAESRRRFFGQIKDLPLLTKILAIASAIFLIIFAISIVYLQAQKTAEENNRIYEENLQIIKNKIDTAESAMIYGDERSAKNQMNEAKNFITLFECRPIDQTTCLDIEKRLDDLSLKLQKMDTVELETVVNWGELGFSDVQKIIKLDTKIIGYSSNFNSILIYDLLTKENNVVKPTENTIGGYIDASVPKEDDYVAFIANDKKSLAIYDPKTNTLKKAQISYSTAESDIKSIMVYNRRLYSLDSANNQIYRHDNIIGGFGIGRNWLQAGGVNIRDGVDITIDGDMFVLKSNGMVYKFSQGIEQKFDLESIDPILDNGNEIWTYNDVKNFYLLDANNKRMVVFDKNGKLMRQITGNELSRPTGMIIEETKNTAFFLDSDKVYRFNLK